MVKGWNNATPASVPVQLAADRRHRRRDAEDNRQRVLAAARRLVRERGIGAVTMDELAARAGVGKGTLYRGFASRAGLAEALLDHAEHELQERILTGPPPLGWGAPPRERLQAFVSAYLSLLDGNVDLLIETERGGAGTRFHTGAYAFWHSHLTALLKATASDNPALQAHALLALLSADLYRHLRAQGFGIGRIETVILGMAG